jgi:hypothetical protein
MPSQPRRARIRPWTLLVFALCMTGCVSYRPLGPVVAALQCGREIPALDRAPTPVSRPPDPPAAVATLERFANDVATAFDVAESKRETAIATVDQCEARQAALVAALEPTPWWKKLRLPGRKAKP